MSHPMIPYCRHHLGEEEIAAVVEVLRSGWIARGPKARELESRFAERLGASHAICCTNGSAALEIALRALGVGPGDEVIVPTLTWVATAMAVRLVGATLVFADIDPETHILCPDSVRQRWTVRTKGVITVDFAGIPHDSSALRTVVDELGGFVVADAAHSLGGMHLNGQAVGADGIADITTFSFHPAKTITTAEGGLLTCADAELAGRIRRIRSSGVTRDFAETRGPYDLLATDVGSNHHLSELHAALGLVQLDRLDELVERRKQAAGALALALNRVGDNLLVPHHPNGSSHNLFIVQLQGKHVDGSFRDGVLLDLRQRGVGAHMHYPLLHRQPVFADYTGSLGPFPVAERYASHALTLPLFPDLTPDQIRHIAEAVEQSITRALEESAA